MALLDRSRPLNAIIDVSWLHWLAATSNTGGRLILREQLRDANLCYGESIRFWPMEEALKDMLKWLAQNFGAKHPVL